MIRFLVDNWFYVLSIFLAAVALFFVMYKFINTPKAMQIQQVREWLKWAVATAEKLYGSGTGQLKLRYVYDKFLLTFPVIGDLISFEMFSAMVDDALEWLNSQLDSNAAMQTLIKGGGTDGSSDSTTGD